MYFNVGLIYFLCDGINKSEKKESKRPLRYAHSTRNRQETSHTNRFITITLSNLDIFIDVYIQGGVS